MTSARHVIYRLFLLLFCGWTGSLLFVEATQAQEARPHVFKVRKKHRPNPVVIQPLVGSWDRFRVRIIPGTEDSTRVRIERWHFCNDGGYMRQYFDPETGKPNRYVEKGKWGMLDRGRKLLLYESRSGAGFYERDRTLDDRELLLRSMTEKRFEVIARGDRWEPGKQSIYFRSSAQAHKCP
ncbi:MAG: hypothetical protein AAGB22_03950 [Bacteroidota bacterium]